MRSDLKSMVLTLVLRLMLSASSRAIVLVEKHGNFSDSRVTLEPYSDLISNITLSGYSYQVEVKQPILLNNNGSKQFKSSLNKFCKLVKQAASKIDEI